MIVLYSSIKKYKKMEKYFSFKTKAISKSRNSSLVELDDVLKQEYVYSSLQKGCTHTHTHAHTQKKNTHTQGHATTPMAFSVVLRLRFLCRILQKRKNKTFFETSIATEEKKKQSK